MTQRSSRHCTCIEGHAADCRQVSGPVAGQHGRQLFRPHRHSSVPTSCHCVGSRKQRQQLRGRVVRPHTVQHHLRRVDLCNTSRVSDRQLHNSMYGDGEQA